MLNVDYLTRILIISGTITICVGQQSAITRPPFAASTSSIQGTVLDPKGKAVIGARVRAVRISPALFTSQVTISDKSGAFSLTSLPQGSYMLCAAVNPMRLIVGDCVWLDRSAALTNAKLIRLGQNERITSVVVRMQPGQKVQVRIKDPDKVLRRPNGGHTNISVQIHGPNNSGPKSLYSNRPEIDGQSYEDVVPVGTSTRLTVEGLGIQVNDELGRPLANGKADQQIQFPAKASDPARHVFQISAK